ncbi:MAG: hypothetical protein IT380_03740 [Myxococcales bacterium]|nr:hypothetical protein [Myxococcales bacterium]
MATGRPKTLETAEDVSAAVDELLGAFAAAPDAEPDDTGFDEGAAPPALEDGEKTRTAPSADADALWGAPKKKPKR